VSDGRLEHAQQMAGYESPRTTKLYNRTKDEITLSEVERIRLDSQLQILDLEDTAILLDCTSMALSKMATIKKSRFSFGSRP